MSRIPGWTNPSSLVLRFALFAGIAVCAQHAGPAWAGVIHHVKADATGTNNGQSWADAYTGLQAALAAAASGDEIWVARGTYKPTSDTLRTVAFVLKEELGLYGGFAGTETELGQRNWEANATILSGDIGIAGDAVDNSYHVVIGADLAVLDGFTITGGNASSRGGGMYNEDVSPTVTNCTFSGNTANSDGGGMHNGNCSPSVTNCTFSGNTAGYGGGMRNDNSSPTVTNCTFSGNTTSGNGDGGGMYNWHSSPALTNCMFSGNTAGGSGGGMYNVNSSPTVANGTFSGNAASGGYGSGGGMYNENSSPTVTNCAFSDNTAGSGGGGMFSVSSSPTVTNCTFSGNTADYGGGMNNVTSSPAVTNCALNGNTAVLGGGMYNLGGSPTVTNCTFSDNTEGGGGGGMSNYDSSPSVTNCIFWDNAAPSDAEIYKVGGAPTFRHCDIKGSGGSGALWNPALGVDGSGNIGGDPRFVAPATQEDFKVSPPGAAEPQGVDFLKMIASSCLFPQCCGPAAPGWDVLRRL